MNGHAHKLDTTNRFEETPEHNDDLYRYTVDNT